MKIEKAVMVSEGPFGFDKEGVLRISEIVAHACSHKAYVSDKGVLYVPGDVTFYPSKNGSIVDSSGKICPFVFDGEMHKPYLV